MDVADVAVAHGVAVEEVEKASGLVPALSRAMAAGGVRVIRVRTDRRTNVRRHEEVWVAVAVAAARRGGGPS
ncbi:MAG TPA: hypothetical protein VG012_00985 [Acidimicrobiia bacterium]|nr:hypothetical protein [Acidimicrobiia bacterium]